VVMAASLFCSWQDYPEILADHPLTTGP
jgi:hypothetical protein